MRKWKLSTMCAVAVLSVATTSGPALAASATPISKTTSTTAKTTATVTRPTLAVSQPGPTGIANVDSLDKIARAAQLALETATTKPNATTAEWLTAAGAATQTELDLNRARDQAWDAVTLQPAAALLINQPLTLAMLDLHIEVRRRLGSTFHTVVPGLVSDQGCRGDLVAERLIYRYGASVSAPLGATAPATTADLDALARQVACLGAAQLAELERALSGGFADVRGRMEARNLNGMVPAFARVVAPVQVLVLDARKHRGAASLSWEWFAAYGAVIEQDVALAGWPTGHLLLWNRRQGVLVGYAACPAGRVQPGCVDFRTFLRSLQDPRALGAGDCAFAGMVNRGIEPLKNGDRYTCPTLSCEPSAAIASPTTSPSSTSSTASGVVPKGGLSSDKRQGLQSLWPQLTGSDLDVMGSVCRMASADMQGGMLDPAQCTGDTEGNPFEQHAACIVEAIGVNTPPQIGGELQGVPMGTNCALADGGSETPQTPAPKTEEPKTEEPKTDEKPWYEKLRDLFTTSSGTGTSTGAATPEPKAVPRPQARQLEEGNEYELNGKGVNIKATALHDQQTGEFVRFRIEITGDPKAAIDLAAREAMEPDSDPYIALLADQIEAMSRKQQDCADPLACTNDCTAVGQMMSAAQACTDDLLSALATAMGKPDKSKLVKRLDIVSYPRPDAETGGEDVDGGMCMPGDLGGGAPARQPIGCGLILCADTLAAGMGTSGCSCRGDAAVYLPADICASTRCADGTVPDAQCQCRDAGGYQPGRPPAPPIDSITRTLEMRGGLLMTTAGDGTTRMIDLGEGMPSRGF
jgi:hypothetical protein